MSADIPRCPRAVISAFLRVQNVDLSACGCLRAPAGVGNRVTNSVSTRKNSLREGDGAPSRTNGPTQPNTTQPDSDRTQSQPQRQQQPNATQPIPPHLIPSRPIPTPITFGRVSEYLSFSPPKPLFFGSFKTFPLFSVSLFFEGAKKTTVILLIATVARS